MPWQHRQRMLLINPPPAAAISLAHAGQTPGAPLHVHLSPGVGQLALSMAHRSHAPQMALPHAWGVPASTMTVSQRQHHLFPREQTVCCGQDEHRLLPVAWRYRLATVALASLHKALKYAAVTAVQNGTCVIGS